MKTDFIIRSKITESPEGQAEFRANLIRESLVSYLVNYYFEHAEWPSAWRFRLMASKWGFVGEPGPLIDDALVSVQEQIRNWEHLDDPEYMKRMCKRIGKNWVDGQMARREHFLKMCEKRDSKRPPLIARIRACVKAARIAWRSM